MGDNNEIKKLQESIQAIEKRLSKLEGNVTKQGSGPVVKTESPPDYKPAAQNTNGAIESKIGEYGMVRASFIINPYSGNHSPEMTLFMQVTQHRKVIQTIRMYI